MNQWEEVTDSFEAKTGGGRWIRRLDDRCWISVLHRLTGFGFMEWETAIVLVPDTAGEKPKWSDREVLIIRGDRRLELSEMAKEQLRDWYNQNIAENSLTVDKVIDALRLDLGREPNVSE